jgi:hypothetical protein
MRAFRTLLFIAITLLSTLTFAYAPKEGNVSGVLGPFLYKTNFDGSSTGATSPQETGVVLMVTGDISDRGSLEIGMFYLPSKFYFRDRDGKYITEKTQVMHVTMGYRRWLSEIVSVSLSLYSAYPMGDSEIVHSDFTPRNDIDTSARDTVEYGFDGTLQVDLWSQGKAAVIADLRYSRSVTPRESEHDDHYGLLLALRYFIKEK